MEPYLGGMLRDSVVRWDAAAGRTTPQGLVALRERLREGSPQAVGISLGTNDGSDPRRFADRIARVLAAIPRRLRRLGECQPPATQGRLRAAQRRAAQVRAARPAAAPDRLEPRRPLRPGPASDRLHPDDAGFRQRSRMYVELVLARAAVEQVVANAPADGVLALVAADDVIALEAVDRVVAALAGDDVRSGPPVRVSEAEVPTIVATLPWQTAVGCQSGPRLVPGVVSVSWMTPDPSAFIR